MTKAVASGQKTRPLVAPSASDACSWVPGGLCASRCRSRPGVVLAQPERDRRSAQGADDQARRRGRSAAPDRESR